MAKQMLPSIKEIFDGEAVVCEEQARTYRTVASLTRESPEYRFALTVIDAIEWYRSLQHMLSSSIRRMLVSQYAYRKIRHPADWYTGKNLVIKQIVSVDYPSVHIVWYSHSDDLGDILYRIIKERSNPFTSNMYEPQQEEFSVRDGIVMGQPMGYS